MQKQVINLGIVGFGRIGRRVGELAHAFGMEVMAFDPQSQTNPGDAPFYWKSLKEVFTEADIVTLHCPQTGDNAGFVDDKLLALWTHGAAVDDGSGVEATLTIPDFSAQKVMGIDVLNGFEQELVTSIENGNLVIENLLIRDYPIILRFIP